MRIIVAGSPAWPDPLMVGRELTKLYLQHGAFVLVHEGGATGVDAAAHRWCEWAGTELGCFEVRHPADYVHHGKDARVHKGGELVQVGADLLVAFLVFDDQETTQVIKLAEEVGVPVKKVMG
ncbi:SLOG family protein [Streptomyces sp. NPDC010273]|uniref:SLOG family protein n=1 Tax=Streptomyces sp. NPDC010273 TaxID=3364829 RepID=UPI0036EC7BD5